MKGVANYPKGTKYIRPFIMIDGIKHWLKKVNVGSARGLAGLVSIKEDLDFVADTLQELRGLIGQDDKVVARKALWFASIIAYGRCFVSSKGRHAILDRPLLTKHLTDSQMQMHDSMISMRHTYVAHAGVSDQQHVGVYVAIEGKRVLALTTFNHSAFSSGEEQINSELDLIDGVKKIVEKKLDKAWKRVASDLSDAGFYVPPV